jgi:hypothetical protein
VGPLRLGGKSPAIVFEDADLEKAADRLAFSMFRNSGQICAAQSRLYVQESVRDKFIQLYKEKWLSKVKHGDPLDSSTTQGPMADKLQFDRVMDYISIGKKEGKVAFGGERNGEKGYFIQPTRTCCYAMFRLPCFTFTQSHCNKCLRTCLLIQEFNAKRQVFLVYDLLGGLCLPLPLQVFGPVATVWFREPLLRLQSH